MTATTTPALAITQAIAAWFRHSVDCDRPRLVPRPGRIDGTPGVLCRGCGRFGIPPQHVRVQTDECLSTRAIAPVVGVSHMTVERDVRSGVTPVTPETEVIPEVSPEPAPRPAPTTRTDESAWSRARAANRDGSQWPRHKHRARQKRARRRRAARERAAERRLERRGAHDG